MTPQQEYVAALAAYTAAKERLIEAKRHFDPKTAPEYIAARRARAAEHRAKRLAAWNDPETKARRERDIQENVERMSALMSEHERRWRRTA